MARELLASTSLLACLHPGHARPRGQNRCVSSRLSPSAACAHHHHVAHTTHTLTLTTTSTSTSTSHLPPPTAHRLPPFGSHRRLCFLPSRRAASVRSFRLRLSLVRCSCYSCYRRCCRCRCRCRYHRGRIIFLPLLPHLRQPSTLLSSCACYLLPATPLPDRPGLGVVASTALVSSGECPVRL